MKSYTPFTLRSTVDCLFVYIYKDVALLQRIFDIIYCFKEKLIVFNVNRVYSYILYKLYFKQNKSVKEKHKLLNVKKLFNY